MIMWDEGDLTFALGNFIANLNESEVSFLILGSKNSPSAHKCGYTNAEGLCTSSNGITDTVTCTTSSQ